MTSCHELKVLNVMNNSRLWMSSRTPSHELKSLDVRKSSGLWMT